MTRVACGALLESCLREPTRIAPRLSQMGYSAGRRSLDLGEGAALLADDRRGLDCNSHKHQMEKRSMKHYAGLDVSVKETSVCVVDESGKICREVKVASHPEDLGRVLNDLRLPLVRVGLEAGPLSQWLFSGLAEGGLPVICIETRHTKAFLKAQVNKSDRNDARGIAQMMRVNLFRPVHVKTLASQKHRVLLTARKLLQEKAIAIENDIRGLLRNFGLKVGIAGVGKFDERIRQLVEGMPELVEIMEPLLASRRQLRGGCTILHAKLLSVVRNDVICQRLMTIPSVGPVVSLAFKSTIDIPIRFTNSKAVGAALGLTPVLNQSGESHRVGRVSLCGDKMMRHLLYEAAQVMLTRVKKWSWLKAWAMNIARRRGQQKAIVALARRLAVIMHRMWSDGTDFRWTKETVAPA
jgi:transposase